MKKLVTILLIVLVLTALLALGVVFREPILDLLPIDQSGWKEENGQMYYLGEKGNPLTGWQTIDGKRYYLGTDGIMTKGWQEVDGKRYFLDSTGILRTGWLQDGDIQYYLLSDGSPATGWQTIDSKRYCFGEDGVPLSGWAEDEGKRCYLLSDGKTAAGWVEIEGKPHFFNTDGTPFQGWLTTSDGMRYLDANGTPATGWVFTQDGTYCFDDTGAPLSGWQEAEGKRYHLDESGLAQTGWLETEEGRYFLDDSGAAVTGWLDWSENRYYFDETGAAVTGWLELEGSKYYLTDSGIVRGKYLIDEEPYYFTSTGANIILVNPWNDLPEGFTVDLVEMPGARVTQECKEALEKMLEDCRAAGFHPQIVSSYRSIPDQQANLNNMINSYLDKGYSYGAAYSAATQIVAVPGTSEHHLGLALDLVDSAYPKLNYDQANMPTQKWLMENCWKYGFIMRYPNGTTDITGIIYEPWHYRYVGLELAKELYELDICLEVYLDRLTNDGTTCGGKLVLE